MAGTGFFLGQRCKRVIYTDDSEARVLFVCDRPAETRMLSHGERQAPLCNLCVEELQEAGLIYRDGDEADARPRLALVPDPDEAG